MESQLKRLSGVRGTSSLKCGNGGMMLEYVSCLQTIFLYFCLLSTMKKELCSTICSLPWYYISPHTELGGMEPRDHGLKARNLSSDQSFLPEIVF